MALLSAVDFFTRSSPCCIAPRAERSIKFFPTKHASVFSLMIKSMTGVDLLWNTLAVHLFSKLGGIQGDLSSYSPSLLPSCVMFS
jgi:hypothetical protein